MTQTAAANDTRITTVTAEELDARLDEFAHLLLACVEAQASIGFMLPFSQAQAAAFWRTRVRPGVAEASRVLLAADIDGRLAGTVQLGLDTPANQPHRAEVSKLLVHPDLRRRGIARTLMNTIETRAREAGRSLLTLDTRSGDAAEPLYVSLGFAISGTIPGYCLHPATRAAEATTVMYKML